MKRIVWALAVVCLSGEIARAQNSDIKFIAETLVVQADGTYKADPDLATLTFDISSQDKELRTTYDRASQAMEKIVALADKNGLPKSDVANGVLTVRPYYEGDRKKKAKSYLVQGQIALKIRDFSKIGPILEESVDDGLTDFRSLTYSLADEEAAKQKAVGEAMKRAVGRANAALEQKGQKVGALRFANLDVKQLTGVAEMSAYALRTLGMATETVDVSAGGAGNGRADKRFVPPPPIPQPEKITVSATVQCAFQIQ
ncbi:MAG TPA: SIMPL domain-containing protein [Candidatus Acidoferrum sp.]|nr:SIMPL domain-containing protein [Candidatus Acidoferrum sp.]